MQSINWSMMSILCVFNNHIIYGQINLIKLNIITLTTKVNSGIIWHSHMHGGCIFVNQIYRKYFIKPQNIFTGIKLRYNCLILGICKFNTLFEFPAFILFSNSLPCQCNFPLRLFWHARFMSWFLITPFESIYIHLFLWFIAIFSESKTFSIPNFH